MSRNNPAMFSRGHRVSRPNAPRKLRAEANTPPSDQGGDFALAPSQPKTPVGQMAAYYLQMQPHLFQEAVDNELRKLKEARDADTAAAAPGQGEEENQSASSSMDIVLNRRMAEVRRAEQMVAVEDLMYICILEKFQRIGVELLPRVEPIQEDVATLKALTEGVHSVEAIAMVKEHILGLLGPAAMAYPDTMIKMSKLQAAQVYAASTMFGYFLRRVDNRFKLAKGLGLLPESPEDTVAKLERLFSVADDMAGSDDPDSAVAAPPPDQGETPPSSLVKKSKSALREYVESFDQDVMLKMARLVTVEGAALVDRQTKALFGDVKKLNQEMQDAVGQDATSVEELMERVQQAVAGGHVSSVTMSVGTQRRLVLEAVAYGCFLKDVEGEVDNDYHGLLTPISSMVM